MRVMSKYQTLVNILDRIRSEAAGTPYAPPYMPDPSHGDAVTQARSRAFLHLYLMVSFGLLDFAGRELYITDGKSDGGIDAYYVDSESRTIYFVQSKYRATEENFKSKLVTVNELLKMDIGRILNEEHSDESGNSYNRQILRMQSEIAAIPDIGRYSYKVLILANAPDLPPAKLKQLTGGYPTEVFDNERTYLDMVLPVIAGTYFRQKDIQIAIDLSNKNAGAKISYEVRTTHYDCEITVVFAPIIEIARIMHRFKNSILRFNPRSYLELEGHIVNDSIRNTVLTTDTNEFALFNNGITMLSDETYINEKIGQRNKAQLTLRNPQIINGGQTAYTLSRILEESHEPDREAVFQGKEVLLKVITLIENPDRADIAQRRIDLIDEISTATNQQTPVVNADKFSNNQDHVKIQRALFDRYGILYERKRGEFADGLHRGYISADLLLERNLFFRLYFAMIGDFAFAVRKRLFLLVEDPCRTIQDSEVLDRLYFSLLCYQRLAVSPGFRAKMSRDQTFYLKLYALSRGAPARVEDYPNSANVAVSTIDRDWASFMSVVVSRRGQHWQTKVNQRTGKESRFFDRHHWIATGGFVADVDILFGTEETLAEALEVERARSVAAASAGPAPEAESPDRLQPGAPSLNAL
jgi:hypothetical protein